MIDEPTETIEKLKADVKHLLDTCVPVEETKCDCGRALTMCVSCAQEDYAYAQRDWKCSTCQHLTPFELTDELFTCPVVNIRIHKDSTTVFGCNQHELKPLPVPPQEQP